MPDNRNTENYTGKQLAFIEQYIICGFNATEAARRAGYKGSESTLGSVGFENLRKPKIAKKIQERMNQLVMTADEVLFRLGEQARAEQTNYFDESGNLEIKRLIADGKTHLIKGIKRTQWGRQIEFHDTQAALVHLGKHHQLFINKIDTINKQLNIDMNDLSDKQLKRIASGEDPFVVLATSG